MNHYTKEACTIWHDVRLQTFCVFMLEITNMETGPLYEVMPPKLQLSFTLKPANQDTPNLKD
jgi:hypothetical protein